MQSDLLKICEKMRELYDGVPDARDLLALSTRELAGKLILILRKLDEPINPPDIIAQIPISAPQFGMVDGYSAKYQNEISEALQDAFKWLEENSMIERSDKHPENAELRVLRREAKEIRNEDDFQKLMLWRSVNEDMLHPQIAAKTVVHLARGEYGDAISFAMRRVEIEVRDASGFGTDKYGVDLMHKAFGEGGPLRDNDVNKSEEEGLRFLFAGMIGTYRNAFAHRDVHIENVTEALTIVMFASHLLHIIDSRRLLK